MTKELRRLSIVMLFMFLALFAATSWIQVVEADSLGQNPNNRRTPVSYTHLTLPTIYSV